MSNLLLTIPTSSQGGNNGRLPRLRVPRLRVPRLPRPLQSSSLHQPVRPLLSTCSTTTARSVCAHQVLYMLVRYAQSTRNVARILRVLSQNSRHISCLLAFSGLGPARLVRVPAHRPVRALRRLVRCVCGTTSTCTTSVMLPTA